LANLAAECATHSGTDVVGGRISRGRCRPCREAGVVPPGYFDPTGGLLAFPDRGYAVLRGGEVKLIAAHDEEAAAALLRTALAQAEGAAVVEWLTGRQQWATDVVVAAGLALEPAGAVFVRGDVGRFLPYLPSGAYL